MSKKSRVSDCHISVTWTIALWQHCTTYALFWYYITAWQKKEKIYILCWRIGSITCHHKLNNQVWLHFVTPLWMIIIATVIRYIVNIYHYNGMQEKMHYIVQEMPSSLIL